MPRYLDPKADIVFKKIFGQHPKLLISFLNGMLPLPDTQEILSLEYLPSENVPKIPGLKYSIADVKCTDNHGRTFIVEMQIDWVESFKQRLLFESGHAYVKQLKKGENFNYLKPVYGLGLIATNFDPNPTQWYHHYQLVNVEKSERDVIDQLQLVFVELQKFPIGSHSDKKLRILWLKFMREIGENTQSIDAELLTVPEIKEALALAQEAAYSEKELAAYDSYWMQISTERTLTAGYYDKGVADGMAQGVEQGMAQGIAQGMEEGEQRATQILAKKMRDNGMSAAKISLITGLSISDIQNL